MKLLVVSALTMLTPAAALAQAAPAQGQAQAPAQQAAAQAKPMTVGATVYDPQGAEVGTVEQVTPQTVVVNTGTNKVAVPPTAIGTGAKGPTMSMTKAQLDAAYAEQQAKMQAEFKSKLVAGAAVQGLNGAPLGTIKSADAEFVTLTTAKGDVKLPINGFGPGANGAVTLGLTAEQLDAAIAGTPPQQQPATN